jgi:hypothetical protein
MSRYIDEISARENFQDVLAYMGSEVKRILKKVPTADVVEVVRCRDCSHNRDNGGDCDRTIILNEYGSTEYRFADLEYCSYGERREECKQEK